MPRKVTAVWTTYTEDDRGVRSDYGCALCSHNYGEFNYPKVVEHCRNNHPEFYKKMWDTDQRLPAPLVAAKFHPITQ